MGSGVIGSLFLTVEALNIIVVVILLLPVVALVKIASAIVWEVWYRRGEINYEYTPQVYGNRGGWNCKMFILGSKMKRCLRFL